MSAAADLFRQHAGEVRRLAAHVVAKPFDLDNLLALIAGELAYQVMVRLNWVSVACLVGRKGLLMGIARSAP